MIEPSTVLPTIALLQATLLHGGTVSTPVPHWAVLLVAVPSLWLVIGAGVLVLDRLLRRLEV